MLLLFLLAAFAVVHLKLDHPSVVRAINQKMASGRKAL
jgi:hypothetical protein